jgi:aspartate/methionine/tyrosine aminotransferase
MLRLRDHMTLHLSPLVEFFAARTIEHGAEIVAGRREQARQNLAFLAAWIAGARAEIEWVPPAGGACAFIRFRRLRRVDEFCHRLACEHRVLLIPGSCFNHPAHARLGFGDSPAGLRLGLARLSRLMEQSLRATPPVPAALEGPEILEAPNVSVVNDPH